jgi:predicted phosphodiesterase
VHAPIGLIADTHGLLRPEALAALAGCRLIVHAGDVGRPAVIAGLEALAPVVAVRGNVDPPGAWPEVQDLVLDGVPVHLTHVRPARPPLPPGGVLVCGHSHQPLVEEVDGVLIVNPGSAGPRRFSLPVGVARLWIGDGPPRAELLPLDVAPARAGRRRG